VSRPAVGAQRYEWQIAVVENHLLQRKRTEEVLHA